MDQGLEQQAYALKKIDQILLDFLLDKKIEPTPVTQIRGHRLENLGDFLESHHGLAGKLVSMGKEPTWWNLAVLYEANCLKRSLKTFQGNASIIQEYYGADFRYWWLFVARQASVFARIMMMDPDSIVEVSSAPDSTCNSCVVKEAFENGYYAEHCNTPSIARVDKSYIGLLALSHPHEIQVVKRDDPVRGLVEEKVLVVKVEAQKLQSLEWLESVCADVGDPDWNNDWR